MTICNFFMAVNAVLVILCATESSKTLFRDDSPLTGSLARSDDTSTSKGTHSAYADHLLGDSSNLLRKDVLQATSVSINPNGTWTNVTFTSVLCGQQSIFITSITINSYLNAPYFELPPCVSEFSSLNTFVATNVIIRSISQFSTYITTFSIYRSMLLLEEGTDGIDAEGNIVWGDWWSQLPVMRKFTLKNVGLRGSLPGSIPSRLIVFEVSDNQLDGEIPETLFSAWNTATPADLVFDFSNNQLYGSIPPALFDPFVGKVNSFFDFFLSGNRLTGTVPPLLLQAFNSTSLLNFKLGLSSNNLTGSIADHFFPFELMSPTVEHYFEFQASNNQLTGTISSLWFDHHIASGFIFVLNGNQLSGTLPDILLPRGFSTAKPSFFQVDLSNNRISGTLPPSFIAGSWSQNMTFYSFYVRLGGNELEGTIPANFLTHSIATVGSRRVDSSMDEADLQDFDIRDSSALNSQLDTTTYINPNFTATANLVLAHNRLEGSIPADLFENVTWTSSATLMLDVSHNALTGEIPDKLVSSRLSALQLLLNHNQLTGSIPTMCPNVSSVFLFRAQFNYLSGVVPSLWCGGSVTVDISGNSNISGELPPNLLTQRLSLNASGTGLSGHLRGNATNLMSMIDLSYTNIEFCSTPSNTSFKSRGATSCFMDWSQACYCPQAFPKCSTNCGFVLPTPAPISPPSGCPVNTRPSNEFTCVNGTWVAPSITTPRVVVPSGAGSIIVNGNITSEAIVFTGLGSTITIEGCAANLTTITVELTESDLERLGKTKSPIQRLVVLSSGSGGNGTNCTDLNNVAVNSITRSSSCKKVKVEKAIVESGQTLGAFFTVDSSGCNRWWIILVSVVAAVIVLGAIAGAVAIVLWNKHKQLGGRKAIGAVTG